MRLSYLFFHVRPFLMVAVFPLIIANQTDAAPLASYAGRMSATVIFAVGLAIFLWSHWQVYKPAQWPNDSPIPFLAAEPSRLVTDGAYRYVRNPQLIGIDLMHLGEAIFLWSLPLLAYCLLVCVASALVSIQVEEAQLERRFGGAYSAYKRSAWAFIPGLV